MTNKRVKVIPKRRHRPSKSHLKSANLANSALDRARTGQFPFTVLTMDEAAAYLGGFRGQRRADTCRQCLQSHGVRLLRVGRQFRVRQHELDRLLETGKGTLDVLAEQAAARLHPRAAAEGSR